MPHPHLRGELVFCTDGGRMFTKNECKHPLWRACKRAGLRRIGWHVLRHTCASHLVGKMGRRDRWKLMRNGSSIEWVAFIASARRAGTLVSLLALSNCGPHEEVGVSPLSPAATGPPCGQVLTDAHHCGACGHDCQGGACQAGNCQPVVVASGQAQPRGIAVDSTSVYWVNWGDGTVMKAPLAGGALTTLASGSLQPHGIAVDSLNAYWTDFGSDTVMKVPLAGGAVTTLASRQSGPYAIAVDSTSVYWGNRHSYAVMKVGLEGGAPTTLATLPAAVSPMSLVVDSESVYFTTAVSGAVMKVSLGGGLLTAIHPGPGGWKGIALGSAGVYWSDDVAGTISLVGLGGGASTAIATGQPGPVAVAVDSAHVYWALSDNGTAVARAPLRGGPVTTLVVAPEGSTPVGIALDASSVYWTEFVGGRVMRVAK